MAYRSVCTLVSSTVVITLKQLDRQLTKDDMYAGTSCAYGETRIMLLNRRFAFKLRFVVDSGHQQTVEAPSDTKH